MPDLDVFDRLNHDSGYMVLIACVAPELLER
jgi:hypothetical protein